MDDGFIAKQVVQGNTEAYRLLVLRYERPIFRYLHSFGFRDEHVAELAQEAFLKGFKKISSYDATKSSFATWLFTIAKNCALNEKKRHANIHEFADQDIGEYATEQDDNEVAVITHKKQRLHEALAKLPEHFRNAITLSFLRELSIKDIAEIESVSEGTVKSRVYRGKQMLKELLSDNTGGQQ